MSSTFGICPETRFDLLAPPDFKQGMPELIASLRDHRPWLDGRVPNGFWQVRTNRVAYLDWLGERLGYLRANDWYSLRRRHFDDNRGATLFAKVYGGSTLAVLHDYKPQRDWIPWMFGGVPQRYWQQSANRASYMQWLEIRLEIERPEDWYAVKQSTFHDNFGGGLLHNYYADSVQRAVGDYLPDFDWQPWRFTSVPQGFWKSVENRRLFLQWFGESTGIREPDDWLQITQEMILSSDGASLLADYYAGSLAKLRSEAVGDRLIVPPAY